MLIDIVSIFLLLKYREVWADRKIGTILLFALFIVISWVNTVMTAVLADVVACALLNGKRFSGLIAFILFFVLNYLTAKIGSLVGTGASFSDRMLIESGLELVFAVIMYLCSATIMERRLSV